ncbi:MAG TPA: Gmad2 immunoglobulin-like domain-containing protein, partial [Patescibacteria group bacterium]|nr:Gmad2 immunoglobulin-like domain-containing protein [Patescibacteria group bacterium]
MRTSSFLAAVAAVLMLAGAGCFPGPAAVPPSPPAPVPAPSPNPAPGTQAFGAEATLRVGGSVTFKDGLVVDLLRIGDSRCPEGVQCIWQGELSPVLRLVNGGIGDSPKELTLGTVRAAKAAIGGYAIALIGATVDTATIIVRASVAPAVQDDMLRLTTPREGEVVTSPLEVRGEARGKWYFEAQFPVKLLDADGRVIASTAAHADGDWMTDEFVPFTATLTFDKPAAVTGTLVLEKDNPSDLPQNDDSRSIPVRFGTGVDVTGSTGVRGTVTIGPTCPVERIPPEPGCAPKPYATTLRIATAAGKA